MTELSKGDVVIRAQNISKTYEAGTSPTKLFTERLFGFKTVRDRIEALKPLDVDVQLGTSVGILGRNGAGKSTLLNILAGMSVPATGEVVAYGRIAALIGIGRSFALEETGRTNARRFCRLQGLSSGQTNEAVEKIHDFSELGGHFERPVKGYSSGMVARLNFSCATAVQADVIIIDEVLAVGDAEFRSKCYGHIDASIDMGQTYVMVSHSPAIIGNYCDRALVLNEGELIFDGDPLGAMQTYESLLKVTQRKRRSQEELFRMRQEQAGGAIDQPVVDLAGVSLVDSDGHEIDARTMTTSDEKAYIRASFVVSELVQVPRVACGLRNSKGIMLSSVNETLDEPWLAGEIYTLTFEFQQRLAVGGFLVRLNVFDLSDRTKTLVFDREGVIELQIIDGCRAGMVDLGFKLVDTVPETINDPRPQGETLDQQSA